VDLSGVANSPVESRMGSPEIETKPVAVRPQMKIIGPLFRDRSGKIIRALSGMDPAAVAARRQEDRYGSKWTARISTFPQTLQRLQLRPTQPARQ